MTEPRGSTIFLFFFWYHLGLYTMQETSYLGKSVLVSIWLRMTLNQMMTRVHKDWTLILNIYQISIID